MASGNTYVLRMRDDVTGEFSKFCGQMDGTFAPNGVPIENTNKCSDGNISYVDGVAVSKQLVWSGTIQLANEKFQNFLKLANDSKNQFEAMVDTGVGGEHWIANFVVMTRSDTAPLNGLSTMAVTLNSSGPYHYEPPVIEEF